MAPPEPAPGNSPPTDLVASCVVKGLTRIGINVSEAKLTDAEVNFENMSNDDATVMAAEIENCMAARGWLVLLKAQYQQYVIDAARILGGKLVDDIINDAVPLPSLPPPGGSK
jgi:hypothetical protein